MAGQVSSDGMILPKKEIEAAPGASVYDILKASGVAFVGTAYISSIAGLSEGDGGSKSGWMYCVGDVFPSASVTKYEVNDGDYIQFRYTLDGGPDVK
jgi:hypothetical protein